MYYTIHFYPFISIKKPLQLILNRFAGSCCHSNQFNFNDITMKTSYIMFSIIVDTEAVIDKCIDCGRDFRTYVPRTNCHLPGGLVVDYEDPQLQCPDCDPHRYGLFMNEDMGFM